MKMQTPAFNPLLLTFGPEANVASMYICVWL